VPGQIGFGEILILLLVLLVLFGPKRLPQIGRSLGKGVRDFKDALVERPQHESTSDDGAARRSLHGDDVVSEHGDPSRRAGTAR
jgi:sec-independent protein translocase protein TatA